MKLKLIYYKNILDLAIERLISINEDFFVSDNGQYVLSKQFTKSSLKKDLRWCIAIEIKKFIQPSSMTNDRFIIIGSCYPKDNLLLKHKDESYFPKKLDKLISNKSDIKWLLRENDIKIDISLMNEVFIDIFNDIFSNDKTMMNLLGKEYTNVIAVSHRKMDCYMMFKAIKWIYGSSNCVNLWKEQMVDVNRHKNFVALNDLIHRYVKNKNALNRDYELKMCVLEVKEYLAKKIGV